jgi:hypothetical protein
MSGINEYSSSKPVRSDLRKKILLAMGAAAAAKATIKVMNHFKLLL